MIPQFPTLFKGTLRFNIDPYDKETNESIDALLKKSGLDELLGHPGLNDSTPMRDFMIEEGGKNLSPGEKQLICICRAIVRKAKIVILDETTSNMDVVTEQKILEMLHNDLEDSTLITIVKRLNTIIKSDMVVVMANGQILEHAPPADLICKPQSDFAMLIISLQNN